jgi:transposase
MGKMLHKVKNKGSSAVYANKDACRQCPNRCTASRGHKTVLFAPDTTHVAVKMYGRSKYPVITPPEGMVFHNSFYRKDRVTKKVVIRIKEDKEKLKQRMCLSEHPFGTVKWYHGAHYLLCRGKEKVSGELGLSFLAYNLKRAINMLGVPVLIEGITNQGYLSNHGNKSSGKSTGAVKRGKKGRRSKQTGS